MKMKNPIIDFIDARKGTEKEILVCRDNIPNKIWYITDKCNEELIWETKNQQ